MAVQVSCDGFRIFLRNYIVDVRLQGHFSDILITKYDDELYSKRVIVSSITKLTPKMLEVIESIMNAIMYRDTYYSTAFLVECNKRIRLYDEAYTIDMWLQYFLIPFAGLL
jgi:hypothetical protein